MWELSKKQADFIRNSDARFNIAVGSVRSGKSVCANLAFLRFADTDIEGDFIILGRTERSIRNNILRPFSEYLGEYFHFQAGQRKIKLGKREIHVVGASDVKAEANIRGSTYAAALVDEVTVIPEPVFKQLTYRLSVPGAKLFATTNPDSPYHWFKQDYLDKGVKGSGAIDLKEWKFNFDDNPSLDAAYVEKIKAESHGLWYRRFIDGDWVLADGAIFDFFDESKHVIPHPPNRAREYAVGIDYGTTNPCAFALVGYNPETFPHLWLEKEYYYDSKKKNRQKTDSEYAQDLAKFTEGYPISAIYVDPSAASFKAEMRRAGIQNIMDADNDVMNGIRTMSELLNAGTFKICQGATNSIFEFSNYIWDGVAATKGVEKPLKQHDHIMDAMRYVLYTRYKKLGQGGMTEEDIDRMRREAFGFQPQLPSFYQGNGQFPMPPSFGGGGF